MADFRTFFFSIFQEFPTKRRKIIKSWYKEYPIKPKIHKNHEDVFYEFITNVLYEPIKFSVRKDHFLLLGDGAKSLAIRFEWLDENDRRFLMENVFSNGEAYFKTFVKGENNHVLIDNFKNNPPGLVLSPVDKNVNVANSHTSIFSFVWQREIVRDFVWLILHKAKTEPYLGNHLILALRKINDEHIYGKRDLFISALLYSITGHTNIYLVPCWGFSRADIHPEDAYQKQNFKECAAITTTIY